MVQREAIRSVPSASHTSKYEKMRTLSPGERKWFTAIGCTVDTLASRLYAAGDHFFGPREVTVIRNRRDGGCWVTRRRDFKGRI